LELHRKVWITSLGAFLSILAWWLFQFALEGLYDPYRIPYFVSGGFTENWGRQLSWWTVIGGTLCLVIMFDISTISVRRTYFPSDADLWQEIESIGGVQTVMDEYAAEQGQAAAASQKSEGKTIDDEDHTPSYDGFSGTSRRSFG
jgi:phospholipid-translocating ATPase